MEYINDLTLRQAALKYASMGLFVFPLVKNEKRPLTSNGFNDATIDPNVINEWWDKWPDANIGIPTGMATGWLVLDVDCKNDVDGWSSLNDLQKEHGKLPATLSQFTPSGGGHFIFKYQEKDIRNSVRKLGPGLDVRGNGGYIVVAPSIIGENVYAMTGDADSPADAPEWLVELARVPKAVKKTGPIGEGERNDHIFKVAMQSNREGKSIHEAKDVAQLKNQKCIPPLPEGEVNRTVESAYKYEVNQIPKEIEEINQIHAVVNVGGKTRVLKEMNCPIFNWPDIELSSPKDFKEFYSNRYIRQEGKAKPLGDTWFRHPQRRQYEGLVFAPGGADPKCYNLWRGFAVEPQRGDCSLYLKHIEENIANGSKEVFDYIIGWMAHTVQHPDSLVGTAIVLRGAMGVGKGVFANGFGSLFGRHYLPMNQSSQLTGKFNAHMKDVVVLLADEAFWAGDKMAEGVLKGLITEPYLTIEGKGENAYKMKNHLHMIFATNNDWCVPAGPNERRFFVLDVSDQHQQDHVYFNAIENELKNGGREALLYYLKHYDLKNIDLRTFPKTSALLETKLMSLNPAQKFWFQAISTEDLWSGENEECVIPTTVLHEKYIAFVNNMGVKYKVAENELGIQLSKMLPKDLFKKTRVTIGNSRPYAYQFPSLKECRECFERFLNQKMDWPTEE
jgi:hypothetical protein